MDGNKDKTRERVVDAAPAPEYRPPLVTQPHSVCRWHLALDDAFRANLLRVRTYCLFPSFILPTPVARLSILQHLVSIFVSFAH